MKPKIVKPLFILLIILTVAMVSCDKNNNEDPDVIFTAGSYIHEVGNNTFYKYVGGTLSQITPDDTIPVSNANLPMYRDTIFTDVNDQITCLANTDIFLEVEGRADGLVIYTGDSVGGTSQIYDDWPFAVGYVVTLDEEDIGEYIYQYTQPGVYKAKLVARNFRDIEHDAKEKVYTVEVVVLDPADYPYIDK